MKKAIVFGVNGQDGYYLRNLLEQKQVEVIAISRSFGNWVQGDIGDSGFVTDLIKKHQPDQVFHLAAHSSVAHELLQEHQHSILNGTLNVLEAVYQFSKGCRVFITGSGLQFKNIGEPITATNEFYAGDSYSLARIQSVYAARYYRSKGLMVHVGYLFHHDSPFRKPGHINHRIAEAAKAYKGGSPLSLEIGDTTVEKEFGFAGDIAAGILRLSSQDMVAEACIGTGKAYPIIKWLELCFEKAGADWRDHVTSKENYVPGFKRLVSDPSVMHRIGWQAKVGIEELAEMMMNS